MTLLTAAVNLNYPEPTPQPIGFLEIVQQEQKEVINTRVYAFFLDQKKNKPLADVFLSALLHIIKSKHPVNLSMLSYTCTLEVTTADSKRIDLVIQDTENDTSIAIENKLNHVLHNDLLLYYNHIRATYKIGIVLSLSKTTIPDDCQDKFINITHKEWIDEVRKCGFPPDLPFKYSVYLNDFFDTIDYLTVSADMDDSVKFFFEYAEKIHAAKECFYKAYDFIVSQLQLVADDLKLKMGSSSEYARYIWDEKNKTGVYYVIDFSGLVKGTKQIKIVLELHRDTNEKTKKLDEVLKDNIHLSKLSRDGYRSNTYLHYASKTYEWCKDENPQLSAFIKTKIENDFQALYGDVIKVIRSMI